MQENAVSDKNLTRNDFQLVSTAVTRWADNDMFGHLNNAVYYQLFDSAINEWIIDSTGTDPMASANIPVVAESSCKFFREISFPGMLEIGLRVHHLGTSSVIYELGLFGFDADGQRIKGVAAVGRWVHVYLDRASRRTTPIPDAVRDLLSSLR